ncbi:hypothetical protein [Xylophilus sp.]|uniref:hypothetical protein n=1 Tax=Xylophilus sp. TaxID=2653893 RepID=UPI0013B5C617|nr:hypothetical protein [Xylophilus sp.]KAF1045998.1 MAG: hypothetical protein GAK38_02701 [Xylophilus sp.]
MTTTTTKTAAHLLALAAALFCAGCTAPAPPSAAAAPGADRVAGLAPASRGSARESAAATPRAYRQDAAAHLYGLNAGRIYKGVLPPMLYAIGTLEVDIDRAGRVSRLHWLRAPRHAPEVVAEIERTVRAAAPYPVATRLGPVTYVDTWLWDSSGRFQLDTLTEGQASP